MLTNALKSCHFKDLFTLKSLFIAIHYVLFSLNMYSQQNDLTVKADELIYTNPIEAIKVAEHILNTTHEPQEKAIAHQILSKSYFVKGDYNKAILNAFDIINKSESIDAQTRLENNLIKAMLLRNLYLDKQSEEYLRQSIALVQETPTEKQDSFKSYISLEQIKMLIDRRKPNEAIDLINETLHSYTSFFNINSEARTQFQIAKSQAFLNLSKYDSAFVYINKSLDLMNTAKTINLYDKAIVYKNLGYLQLQNKDFEKSEETFFIAMRFAEILDNPFLLEQINKDLANNYLASNQRNKHIVYNEEFLIINSNTDLIEQESVNTAYNLISENHSYQVQAEEEKQNHYLKILLAIALVILTVSFLILFKSEGRKKRLREIINYLIVSKNNFINILHSKKKTSKRVVITEETEKNILRKLKRFESSKKFINRDVSLTVLAVQFETNTKYLSEIINKHYNDNFNTYINKLRINYVIDKLKNDSNYINYKISVLAEESGFSSHSSFATVFKSIIGMSPATFIDLLKTERDGLKNKKKHNAT